jgi:hypothetical protein
MSDVSITSPVPMGPGNQNWMATQFLARGNFTVVVNPLRANIQPGLGRGPNLACTLQKQSDGSKVADGSVVCAGTSWWARFGRLTNVDTQTQYQLVATLDGAQPFLDQQLYFNPGLNITFAAGTGTQFPLAFHVTGGYMSGSGYTVSCYLLSGTTTVAVGVVTLDQPQPGQWTAQFNLNAAQQNCSLVAEMFRAQPMESVGATWIDGVSVG